ncbi:MAG TPA: prepilin-type N-terminal cleavage/methylation domain-containing protein [Armatimonadota bacterium]|jgi:prepilin-type N-terminal cleavage/methylation domain-containing protein
MRRGHRGFSLLGMLVAVLIIAVAAVLIYGRSNKQTQPIRPGGPSTRMGIAVDRGRGVDCQNNLKQLRLAIQMEETSSAEGNGPPPTLQSLSKDGIIPQMLVCPATHQPYQYDPRTGVVICPTIGHEKF